MTRQNVRKNTVTRWGRHAVISTATVGLALALGACGGDDPEQTPDNSCQLDFDCATGESCVNSVCVPTGTGDTDIDTTPDVVDQDTDTGVPDVTEDPTTDPGTDPGTDPVDDPSTDPDTDADVPDTTPDVDADADGGTPDADVDADPGPDTDIEVGPDFNPWVAYVVNSTPPRLEVVRADGTDTTVLSVRDTSIRSPRWSPDGTRLAYAGFEAGDTAFHIRIINFTDNTLTTLDPTLQQIATISWSPEGNQLVVEGRPAGGTSALYVVDSRTGATTQFTSPTVSDAGPTWTWGSNEIFFVRNTGSAASPVYDVFAAAADAGASPRQVTSGARLFGSPAVDDAGTLLYYQAGSPPRLQRRPVGGTATPIGIAQDVDADLFPGNEYMVIARLYPDTGIDLAVVTAADATEIRRITFDADTNSSPDVAHVESSTVDVSLFGR